MAPEFTAWKALERPAEPNGTELQPSPGLSGLLCLADMLCLFQGFRLSLGCGIFGLWAKRVSRVDGNLG